MLLALLMKNKIYGLGKGVLIKAHVDISFGLAVGLSVAVLKTVKEVIMGNNSSNMVHWVMISVWCGAAFLRSLVEKSPTQANDRHVLSATSSKSERAGFNSPPPPQFARRVLALTSVSSATSALSRLGRLNNR